MMGSRLRVLPGNALSEEQTLPWEQLAEIRLDHRHPWFEKYMEFAEVLVRRSNGRFPVSHGTLHGPSDMLASLRGHGQSVIDLLDEPQKSRDVLWQFAHIFEEITAEVWKRLPPYCGGYFDASYQLWTRGPVIRMQEDAIAVYSPELYREFVQPIDRYLAGQFAGSFMHLHSTSMFLLDLILEIEELRCLQVNYEVDSGGPDIHGMIPFYQKIQRAGRPLLVRASFTPDELRAVVDGLDPRGLYLYLMVADMREVETLRPILGM